MHIQITPKLILMISPSSLRKNKCSFELLIELGGSCETLLSISMNFNKYINPLSFISPKIYRKHPIIKYFYFKNFGQYVTIYFVRGRVSV